MESRLKRIQTSFELIEYVPKDRLEYLDYSFKARGIIVAASAFLDTLKNSDLSAQYDEEDLKLIHGHFCEAARCLLELVRYYYEKVVEEINAKADKNPFVT